MSRRELGNAALSGVRWLAAARGVAELAGLASTLVLARLIAPAAFGEFAVVSLLLLLSGSFGGSGIAATVVQRRELGEADLRSAVLLALGGGSVLTALTLGLSPLFAAVLGEAVGELARLAAPTFLIAGFAAVSEGLLQRRLEFARLGTIDVLSALLGSATAVALAIAGLEAEALVIGALVGQALGAALIWRAAPPPAPRGNREGLRELGSFAATNAAANTASLAYQNVDYVVLGAQLSPAQVGFYWRAYGLGVAAQSKLSMILVSLGLPLYARSQSAGDRLAIRSRIVQLQSVIIFPLLAGLILLAPWFVPTLFGSRWEPAVELTQILAGAGMVNALMAGIGPLIVAAGHPGALLRWNLSNTVMVAAVVYLTAPAGLVAVCWAVLATRLVRLPAAYYFLLHRLAGVPLRYVWLDAAPALIPAATAVAVAGALQEALFASAASNLTEVAVIALAVLSIYALSLRLAFPKTFAMVWETLRRLLRGGREPDRPGTAQAGAP